MLDERLVDELTGPSSPRAWVEAHLDRFAPTPSSSPSLEDVKPLCELGLILYALGDEGWAREVAAAVAPRVAAWEADVRWTTVVERAAVQPRAVAVTMPGLLWELLTGCTSTARPALDAVVAAAGDVPDLDVAFVRDLAGRGSCEPVALAALRCWRPGGWSWGYELTHAVFYATRMGRRAVAFDPRVRETLMPLMTEAFARRDADLGAELLLAMAWSDGRALPSFAAGQARLRALAASGVELDPHACDPSADAFDRRYHPTLVTLAALTA